MTNEIMAKIKRKDDLYIQSRKAKNETDRSFLKAALKNLKKKL